MRSLPPVQSRLGVQPGTCLQRSLYSLIGLLVFCGGCVTTPPPTRTPAETVAAPVTLPRYLGLGHVIDKHHAVKHHLLAVTERYVPVLAPGPPLVPLTDPSHADSSSDAVRHASAAAKKKAQIPQIKMALATVAEIGCGCDPSVEQALLAGLADCSPEVRLAAIEAIYSTIRTTEGPCDRRRCCTPPLRNRLREIGWGRDPTGCWTDSDGEVRLAARETYRACGCPLPEVIEAPTLSAERPDPSVVQEANAGSESKSE